MSAFRVLVLFCALCAGSCVQHWERVSDAPTRSTGGSLLLRGPDGWVRWKSGDAPLLFTRDSPAIQQLVYELRPLAGAYPATARSADRTSLPSELAERAVAEAKKRAGFSEIEVLANEPATLAGSAGFRLHLRHTRPSGLRIDHLIWGAVAGGQYLRASFTAPTLHYFERDRAAVERSVATFRLNR